jgi:apolipoprotein N-acyltransferase
VPRLIRYAARAASALVAGVALWLSFPEHNLWWLAPVGVALLAGSFWRQGWRAGAGLGLLAGLAYFVPVLSWSGTYVGKLPWFALSFLQALYIAAMGALVGWGSRRLGERGRRAEAYGFVPLGWLVQELARSTTPWGGFPWARLAFSQADSPLVKFAAWGGAPGVSLLVALVGTGLLAVAHSLVASPAPGATHLVNRSALVAGVLAATMPFLAVFIPLPVDGQPVTVGMVQGNVPQAGLEFNAQRRAVLDNHVRGTLALAERSVPDLSLVVWPENSSDIDPFRNADAAAQIQRALGAVGVPLLVGAVLRGDHREDYNTSLLYRPGGGEPERYTKLHPVPFAEYIPYRSFFRTFSDKVDLAGNFVAGDTLGAFEISSGGGSYWALPTICFEVAYDGLMRDSATQAGKDPSLLVVQTNNATFGYTAESEQQFAISRLRAIEHGRSVVHVSTVGVSGFIAPDGSVSGKTRLFTPVAQAGSPVVRSDETVSDRLGRLPDLVACLGLGVLVITSLTRRSVTRVTSVSARDPKAPA